MAGTMLVFVMDLTKRSVAQSKPHLRVVEFFVPS
jgi:hypothetical protein